MSGQLEFGEEDRSVTLQRAWELALHLLASKISQVSFSSFVRDIQPLHYVGNVITLGVTTPFAREWVEKKHLNAIRSALEFHLDTSGLEVQLVLISAQTSRKESASKQAQAAQPALPLDAEPEEAPASAPPVTTPPTSPKVKLTSKERVTTRKPTKSDPGEPLAIPSLSLNDRYHFEAFLTGRSNRLAHAGAVAVAARPGEVYNPLFLYGGPGLGKTHLMQAIAHSLKRTQPALRVAYVSGEYFAQHYISALRDHATETFRRQYREIDVWLVDDVQFIAGKEHTKEEFFHTFNALYQNGKQVVIASDRSPRELNTMDERLRSRFQSGLIADIGPPELETRIAILQQCRQREGVRVDDDVLTYIASAIQSNIRALEGALTKLIAFSSIMNAPMSAELAQSVLGEYFIEKPVRTRRLTLDEVILATAETFGTTPEAIKGPNRNKDIVLVRHVAMYLCRELLPEVNTTLTGAAFGGRDHATIVYACQRLRTLMEVDGELHRMVQDLIRTLT